MVNRVKKANKKGEFFRDLIDLDHKILYNITNWDWISLEVVTLTERIKDKKPKKNIFRSNDGFTLVEMIVTFLVLGILLSVSVMSLVAWQDWADFNRENEYAETLFLAAQNQLSEYSENGTLSDFSDRAYKEAFGNKVNLDSIYYAEGENYTAELKKENSVWVSKEAGTLCYAMCNKGDYVKYKSGEETDSKTAAIVFELLESYVYDTSILNETICIEFSLEDGQVFSAFYTDKFIEKDDADYAAFEYNNSNDNLRGLVNIATRYETYRRERMVGYYGVDTLSAALVSKNDKPTISKISLNNEETLNLSFKLGKYASATNELTYKISVFDNKTKKKTLDITLDTSKNPLKNYENRDTVPCEVIRYTYDGDGNATSENLGKFDILAYLDKDNQVRVVLDAVDVQATTELYNKDFSKLSEAESVKNGSVKFSKTLSFHRFGLNAEKIYCSVQGYSARYKATSVKQSNVSDAFFANETSGEENAGALGTIDHFNYTIKNARHLYNVRYLEDLSEADLAAYKETEGATAYCTYALIKDIDWAGFVEGENYYSSNAHNIILPNGTYKNANVNIVTDRSFASCGKLRMYDKFIGNDFTVKGLKITEAFNSLSGLYGYENLNDVEKPVGLFNINYGLIKTTKLDKIQVTSSSDKVGAFCGVNVSGVLANDEQTGVLNELTLLNSGINTNDASVILGKEHVGGIVGYLQATGEDRVVDSESKEIVLSKLTNYAKVTGDKYVGGIIGEVRNSKTKKVKIIIDECVNKGAVLASNSEVDENGVVTVKTNTDPLEAKYIGGITGYTANIYANTHDDDNISELITVRNCLSSPLYSDSDINQLLDDSVENAATVLSKKLNGVYVGGIVGYNYYGSVQNCSTKGEKGKQGYVFGYRYVGGIVGFNQGPASGIKGGNDKVSGVNEANVVGCEYVGGITGCNADVDSDKLSEDALSEGINISGKYANEILEASDIIVVPDTDRNIDNKIENWINKGVIFSTGKYAGGISGYNCGWIYNCNSEVESANVDGFFQSTYSSGDFTGGISGYNNGVIGNTKREMNSNGKIVVSGENKTEDERKISAVCYISGKNYVGGIVGYNDVDAIVEDYELAGGYILGDENEGSFVGGYAGFNSSLRLFVDDDGIARAVISKPNRVIGEYFVGGSVGGNIINTDSTGNIPTIFKTDNFLGTVYGKAFVGGFVGYNMVTDTAAVYYGGETRYDVSNLIQQEIVDAFATSDLDTTSDNQKLIDKVNILNNIYNNDKLRLRKSNATMYISGSNEQMTQNSLGRIEADICIGGVFGYNDDNTKVYVKDVENTTPIIADAAIVYNEQNGRNTDYAGREYIYDYSYAGGIIGKVSQNMTIDNCSNSSSGTVSSMGTYTGGLAEVNNGLITSCKTNSFGKSVDDYIGGICGLNKEDGRVENCTLKDITISGRNVVGGIAAENFGTISGSDVSGLKLLVSGKDVVDTDTNEITIDGMAGGLAAYNGGKINVNKDINVTITSSGNYSGAVTAYNDGNGVVINDKLSDSPDLSAESDYYADKYISVTGNINGNRYVGGVIGKNTGNNTSNIIAGFTNKAVVNATRGTVGGIVGDNESGNIIAFCDNYEVITATNAGNAGGITSVNSSTITKCNNYAEIKAPSGMCGGIAAINNEDALISYCLVEPKSGKTSIDFSSNDAVGGISALNSGNIENVKLKNINVHNYTTSDVSNIGVVVGINEKTGLIKLPESNSSDKVIDNCTARTYTDYSFAGGVAGTNKGTINGASLNSESLPTTVIESFVGFMPNSASIASLGGVAGANLGLINNISVDGQIIGDLGSDVMGYGGIAGINGYSTYKDAQVALEEVKTANPDNDGYTAKITNCTFDGEVFGEGSGAGIALIGGIAGSNAYGGEIEHCYIGVITDDNSSNDIQRVTKIYAGKQETTNSSGQTVMTVDPGIEYRNKNTDYEVKIITSAYDKMSYAYIGGIAGDNYGRVASCDNYAKSKEPVRIYSYISSSGGIVGYSYQGSFVTGTKDEHLTSGENWEVKSRSTDNDRGNGGIIGYYKCTNDIEYCDNYASVECVFKANTSIGGVVGFINQSYDSSVNVFNCNNYGNILGYTRTGGIVSHLSFTGIRFENCTNYGNIRALADEAAGILQCIWQPGYDMVFINCYNHGNILSNSDKGAGFYAKTIDQSVSGGGRGLFINCVNTGTIGKLGPNDKKPNYSSSVSSNMAGFSTYDASGNAYYTNCRNYYGYGNIYGLGRDGVNAKDCLDISQTDKSYNANQYIGTLAKKYNDKAKTTNNFYVLRESSTPYNNARYGVYTNITSNYTFVWISNNNRVYSLYEAPDASKRIRSLDTIKSGNKLIMDFDLTYDESSLGADGLAIYFANQDNSANNSNQVNEYSYTLYDESGNKLGDTINGKLTVPSNSTLEEGKVVLDFGAYKGKQVAKVRLETINMGNNNTASHYTVFHGFGYIPSADATTVSNLDPVNNYIEKMTDTGVTFKASSNLPIATGNTSFTNADGYQHVLLSDFTSDLAKINGERLSYNLSNYGQESIWLSFDFDFTYGNDAKGLGALYLYLNTRNGLANGEKRNYAYYAVLTDENGNSYNVGSRSTPITAEKALQLQEETISVPAACTGKVVSVKLYLKCTNNSYINFNGFKWSEKGSTERILIPYNTKSIITDKFQNTVASELIYEKQADGTVRLYPNISGLDNEEYGIIMVNDLKADTFYNDFSDYKPSYDTAEGENTWAKDTRVAVYKELDPKYEEFLYSSTYNPYVKLPMSTKFTVTNSKGQYVLSWNKVDNATGYFTHYKLVDENGNVIYTSEDIEAIKTAESTDCYTSYSAVKIDNLYKANGGTGSYSIVFYAKAVSAYHRLADLGSIEAEDKNLYDSEYFTTTVDALEVLPAPMFHIEYITGNKAVVVIDNFEDYQAIENYEDAVEIVVNANSSLSSQGKIFDGAKNITIKFTSGRSYSEPFTITNALIKEDTGINIYARPTEGYKDKYYNSVTTYIAGEIMNSAQHADGADNKLYAENITFLGFFGTQLDELKYNIQIAANQIDVYVVGDLVAQDDTLGVEVAYDRGNIHSASRAGGVTSYTTISLSGLPEDLLEKDFEVRSYLYATQNDILRFGHEVASGLELEDIDDVKAVTDENYFNEEGIKASDLNEDYPSIYDDVNGKLKPGYVIYDNHDGTYDVYYSASLDADEQNGSLGHYQVHRMPYSYHDDMFDELGYNYYIGKDVNYTGTDSKDTNIAKSKVVMSTPTTITERDGSEPDWSITNGTSGGKFGKDVTFNYTWIPTYEDERFDYQLKNRSNNGNNNAIRGSFSTNTSGSCNEKIYYADKTSGPTYDEIYAHGRDLYITRRDQLVQPKPVIDDVLVQGKNDAGKNTYTFTWDTGKTGENYKGAEYSVVLVGTSLNGEKVILTTPQLVSENTITFTDTENNWRYVEYTIKVTRLGTLDPDSTEGKTNFLPSISTKTCNCKLSLSQLPKPDIELHSTKDASGHTEFDKDRQLYDVTWDSITDAYEKNDLGGYLIMVNVIQPADPDVVAKTHYYYITDANATNHDDTIGLDVDELSNDGENVVVNLAEDKNSEYDTDYSVVNRHRAFIDLSDFNGKDKLNIRVCAIARTGAENYIDGPYSEATEMTLNERHETPDIEKLSDDLEDAAPYLTITQINNTGIVFTYADETKAGIDGFYDIAIAVYDDVASNTDEVAGVGASGKVPESGDGAANSEGYWNSGASKTLVSKSEKSKMDGEKLSSATYEFKLGSGYTPSDYAGKWLKIALRARSNDKISSWWTDEDPDGATANYYWVQIPKVKLDSPGLGSAEAVVEKYYYNPETVEWTNVETDATLRHIEINKRAFDFDVVDYTDAFEIKYIGFDGKVQYVYLVPNNEAKTEFTVYGVISGSEVPYLEENGAEYTIINNNYVVEYGMVNSENSVNLPYGAVIDPKVYVDDASVSDSLFIPATVGYNNGKIMLVLPDLTGNVLDENNHEKDLVGNNNFTKQITVQALISADNENNYVASPVNIWSRSDNTDSSGSINNSSEAEAAIVDITEGTAFTGLDSIDVSLDKVVGAETKYYYNASLASSLNLIYRIRVMDVSGAEPALVGASYAVTNSVTVDDVTNEVTYSGCMAVLNDYIDDTTGKYKLYISAAKISDGNGISEWSDEWYFSKTGIGEKVQAEP